MPNERHVLGVVADQPIGHVIEMLLWAVPSLAARLDQRGRPEPCDQAPEPAVLGGRSRRRLLLTNRGPIEAERKRRETMVQQAGPPCVVIVVCEGDEMERHLAKTVEERDRLLREMEQKYRNCLINVVHPE
jgi:hypothetical protein